VIFITEAGLELIMNVPFSWTRQVHRPFHVPVILKAWAWMTPTSERMQVKTRVLATLITPLLVTVPGVSR
jgi:hypothetical protein